MIRLTVILLLVTVTSGVKKCPRVVPGDCRRYCDPYNNRGCGLGHICCSDVCGGSQCICPAGKTQVYCIVDPCYQASCPTIPHARCIADSCDCSPRWFVNGIEVTRFCPRYGINGPTSGVNGPSPFPGPTNGINGPSPFPGPTNGLNGPSPFPGPTNGINGPSPFPGPTNGLNGPSPFPGPTNGLNGPSPFPGPTNGLNGPSPFPDPTSGIDRPISFPSPTDGPGSRGGRTGVRDFSGKPKGRY